MRKSIVDVDSDIRKQTTKTQPLTNLEQTLLVKKISKNKPLATDDYVHIKDEFAGMAGSNKTYI